MDNIKYVITDEDGQFLGRKRGKFIWEDSVTKHTMTWSAAQPAESYRVDHSIVGVVEEYDE